MGLGHLIKPKMGYNWLINPIGDVQIRKYANHSSNIIVPKYGYRTYKDYATNY